MVVAVSATIAAVAKKVLTVLLGDKKGRKFLGYVLGIAVFIILIPVITLFSLFGWMGGDGGSLFDHDSIISSLPIEQQKQIEELNSVCDTIVSVFKNYGLTENDQRKASAIYISYLDGMEEQVNFYTDLVSCFLYADKTNDVYDLITATFGVLISDEDRARLDELYGVTGLYTGE